MQTREQQIAELEKDWAENPRWANVKRGYSAADVVRLRGVGMPQLDTHRRGDLYVHLRVVVPRRLTAEQKRLVGDAASLGDDAVEGSDQGLFDRLKRALGSED